MSSLKIIKELGCIYPTKTSTKKSNMVIAECPMCKQEFRTYKLRINKTKMCRPCTPRYTHNEGRTRLYTIWVNIKARCNNSKNPNYKYYGGRGIKVCNDWNNSYEIFRDWALENGYQDNLTLDRENVNGNYEALNCRWVDMNIQNSNQNIKKNNTTGYKNVYFNKRLGKWTSQIQYKKKQHFLGVFDTAIDAAIACNNYIDDNNLPHTKNEI